MIMTGLNNGDSFVIKDLDEHFKQATQKYVVENTTQGYSFTVSSTLNDRERKLSSRRTAAVYQGPLRNVEFFY